MDLSEIQERPRRQKETSKSKEKVILSGDGVEKQLSSFGMEDMNCC